MFVGSGIGNTRVNPFWIHVWFSYVVQNEPLWIEKTIAYLRYKTQGYEEFFLDRNTQPWSQVQQSKRYSINSMSSKVFTIKSQSFGSRRNRLNIIISLKVAVSRIPETNTERRQCHIVKPGWIQNSVDTMKSYSPKRIQSSLPSFIDWARRASIRIRQWTIHQRLEKYIDDIPLTQSIWAC